MSLPLLQPQIVNLRDLQSEAAQIVPPNPVGVLGKASFSFSEVFLSVLFILQATSGLVSSTANLLTPQSARGGKHGNPDF